jgi:hypothetical protein
MFGQMRGYPRGFDHRHFAFVVSVFIVLISPYCCAGPKRAGAYVQLLQAFLDLDGPFFSIAVVLNLELSFGRNVPLTTQEIGISLVGEEVQELDDFHLVFLLPRVPALRTAIESWIEIPESYGIPAPRNEVAMGVHGTILANLALAMVWCARDRSECLWFAYSLDVGS